VTGDTVRDKRIKIRGVANEDALTGKLKAGETVTVYPTETTVRIVWYGAHDTSYTLATFDTFAESDDAVPFDIDEKCPWVESQTNGGTTDITISGYVVACDVETDGEVDIDSDGVVAGDVDSHSNGVQVDPGQVYGSISASSDATLDGAAVGGDIETTGGGSIDVDNSEVSGRLDTNDNPIDVDNTTVQGDVNAGGNADFDILDGSTVEGNVISGSSSTIDIRGGSTVDGSILGEGDVSLDGVTVQGHVYVNDAQFSCSSSTINGQDCSSYSSKDPGDW
jgi:cytoskeletal protein CcmA (bactofilin family)